MLCIRVAASLVLLVALGEAQFSTLFSDQKRTDACSSWSGWGRCIWTEPFSQRVRGATSRGSNLYLKQLSPDCSSHWFYEYIKKNYGIALDNFFRYLRKVTKNSKPCGKCSYRQSCGSRGPKQCHREPASVGRPTVPFFVAEQLCKPEHMNGHDQSYACYADYDILKRNGGECRLWPATGSLVNLASLDSDTREFMRGIQWSSCVPQETRKRVTVKGRQVWKDVTVCRCCCHPFEPNPNTYKCVLKDGFTQPS